MGCAVYAVYGAMEAGTIGFQCERRDGFHLNSDLCAVRIADADGNPVKLVGARPQCSVSTEKPYDSSFQPTPNMRGLFATNEANIGMGMSFANKISVQCP